MGADVDEEEEDDDDDDDGGGVSDPLLSDVACVVALGESARTLFTHCPTRIADSIDEKRRLAFVVKQYISDVL
jgi:hypothetical protein